MAKKVFSVIVTFLIMMVLAFLSTTLILRSFLNIDTVLKIVNSATKETIPTFDEAMDKAFKETGFEEEISEYIDTKDLQKAVEEYLKDYIGYQLGEESMPTINSPEVNKILDKAIDKFEEKTGEKIDRSDVDKALEEFDTNLAKNDKISSQVDSQTLEAMKFIYIISTSKALIIGLIIALIVLIAIVFLLNMNVTSTIAYLISAFLINGICIIVIPIAMKLLGSSLNAAEDLINTLSKPFYIYGMISIGISILLIITNIIIKIVKKNTENKIPVQQ